jgi:S1-C subfamily serine protease
MGFGGMRLDDLDDSGRAALRLPADRMALKVRHVGEFGAHAVAKKAGVRKGDVIVSFDGREGRMSESDLLAYTVQQKRPGDEVTVTVLRDGERKELTLTLQ